MKAREAAGKAAGKAPKRRRKARVWVVFLTDRVVLGAPLRLVSARGLGTTGRADLARRFASPAEARRRLRRLPAAHRLRHRFAATFVDLGPAGKGGGA